MYHLSFSDPEAISQLVLVTVNLHKFYVKTIFQYYIKARFP